jgi:hypothetical protein
MFAQVKGMINDLGMTAGIALPMIRRSPRASNDG